MSTTERTVKGEIKVASRIIDYLSSGLYKSPAACIKELINNSYDADASKVEIFIKPDADRIIIEDNGCGISDEEFKKHFNNVSESRKRDTTGTTRSGRPKIGKIGIGFIAANELCDVMELFSTKSGSTELLHITIDFSTMRLSPEERRRQNNAFAKADYKGKVTDSAKRDEHYTRLFLKNVRGEAKNILVSALRRSLPESAPSLYGLKPDSIEKKLVDMDPKSWDELDSYSRNLLEISLNIPVQYHDNWLPHSILPKVSEFVNAVDALKFKVFVDGSELRKPVILGRNSDRFFLHRFSHKGKEVSYHGYAYCQHGAIRPQELNGLLIRIRNAAVGDYNPTFLDYPSTVSTIFQRWASIELWADDRLESAMNIDRVTLRDVHPAFVELKESFHVILTNIFKKMRADLYEENKKVVRYEKAKKEVQKVKSSLRHVDLFRQKAPTSNKTLVAIETKLSSVSSQKGMLHKYSVSELYDIVIEVASDLLTKEQMETFLKRLTKRLFN